eukprot:CAMPEP_0204589100 /NCGR_PEP_ID=MMETSP0661-20131031/49007_1 /ASSEMBLY_ACC=CAM_ASM_000606 /TAXON_ID=109239 /ORGANISM="Alexandrium margalefi, Strain AMGDE01CS-322" /LENGTH=333 /DNA_ID=CAMNT_0051598987 /DNA_START=40 /DNA_END=1041 /DNA_ORIENTATION=+
MAWRGLTSALLLAAAAGLRTPLPGAPEAFQLLEDREGSDLRELEGLDEETLSWAISEAVAEVLPTKLQEPAPAAPETGRFIRQVPSNAVQLSASRGRRWFYGSHHKSGTDLLRNIAANQVKHTKIQGCFSMGKYGWRPYTCGRRNWITDRLFFYCTDEQMTQGFGTMQWFDRGVHMLRDPLSMLVSGYIYHQNNPDTPEVLLGERSFSVMEGLTREAEYILEFTGKSMLRIFTTMNGPEMLHVRYESLTSSSAEYDRTVWKIYNHTIGEYREWPLGPLLQDAEQFDLKRNTSSAVSGHVARQAAKRVVQRTVKKLPKDVMTQLRELRASLGYE